jgi:DnaJ-class molecular chaperone
MYRQDKCHVCNGEGWAIVTEPYHKNCDGWCIYQDCKRTQQVQCNNCSGVGFFEYDDGELNND